VRATAKRLRAALDVRLLLLLLAALATALALAGPTLVLPRPVHRYLFVVDITESMNVADVGPTDARTTRIALARDAIAHALTRLRCGSEAGLALFAEHRALTLVAPVEVCSHYGLLADMVAAIDWRMAWRGGSQVARGLESGMRAAAALGPATRVVFVSDGHEAPPVNAQLRLPVDAEIGGGLVVGVGGDELVPIPVLDDEGRVTGWFSAGDVQQVDSHTLGRSTSEGAEQMAGVEASDVAQRIARGTEHYSSLREDYLRRLASESGLDYFRLTSSDALGDRLRDRRLAHAERVATDLQPYLALVALGLLGAAFVPPFAAVRRHARAGVSATDVTHVRETARAPVIALTDAAASGH
jgi:mxaL protein